MARWRNGFVNTPLLIELRSSIVEMQSDMIRQRWPILMMKRWCMIQRTRRLGMILSAIERLPWLWNKTVKSDISID